MTPFSVFLEVIQRPEVIAVLVAAALFGSLIAYVARGRPRGRASFGPLAPRADREALPRAPRAKLFAKKPKEAAGPAGAPDGSPEGGDDVEFHAEDEDDGEERI